MGTTTDKIDGARHGIRHDCNLGDQSRSTKKTQHAGAKIIDLFGSARPIRTPKATRNGGDRSPPRFPVDLGEGRGGLDSQNRRCPGPGGKVLLLISQFKIAARIPDSRGTYTKPPGRRLYLDGRRGPQDPKDPFEISVKPLGLHRNYKTRSFVRFEVTH